MDFQAEFGACALPEASLTLTARRDWPAIANLLPDLPVHMVVM